MTWSRALALLSIGSLCSCAGMEADSRAPQIGAVEAVLIEVAPSIFIAAPLLAGDRKRDLWAQVRLPSDFDRSRRTLARVPSTLTVVAGDTVSVERAAPMVLDGPGLRSHHPNVVSVIAHSDTVAGRELDLLDRWLSQAPTRD